MKEENETTIGELVKGKRKLEEGIAGMLREFEDMYVMEVRGLNAFRVQDFDGKAKYVVSAELRI